MKVTLTRRPGRPGRPLEPRSARSAKRWSAWARLSSGSLCRAGVEGDVPKTNKARVKTPDVEAPMFARIAEDVGRLIGTTERRASEWLAQRQTLVDRLT